MNLHKLSSCQIRIIALCFLIVAIDGFDTASRTSSATAGRYDVRGAILATESR